uniref:helix-turn-helix domain-containing protein n=1 Tax=Motilibacter peucedani TaxID=598650 RepID=UPI001600C553
MAAQPAARSLGLCPGTVRAYLIRCGGVRREPRQRARDRLGLQEREEISRGLAAGKSLRRIASELGRAPSTVCREVARHGGRCRYRAARADQDAWVRAARPKRCKLAVNTELRRVVQDRLEHRWSPAQIAGWLRATQHPPGAQVAGELLTSAPRDCT